MIKTFDDLDFRSHPAGCGLMARMQFLNGYGISVVRFRMFDFSLSVEPLFGSHTDNENEWEVAVLHYNAVCYDTPITDDVIGHLSEDGVTEIMFKIQELPEKIKGDAKWKKKTNSR